MEFGWIFALIHIGMISLFSILLVVLAMYEKRNEEIEEREYFKNAA